MTAVLVEGDDNVAVFKCITQSLVIWILILFCTLVPYSTAEVIIVILLLMFCICF